MIGKEKTQKKNTGSRRMGRGKSSVPSPVFFFPSNVPQWGIILKTPSLFWTPIRRKPSRKDA
jgi:hypothetical protein